MINIPKCLLEGIELPQLLRTFPQLCRYLTSATPMPLIPAYPFVAVEGIDGAGKGLFLDHLLARLSEEGIVTERFRMPGATNFGEDLRTNMKSERPTLTLPSAIVPAMAANTADVVERIIAPQLKKATNEVLPVGSTWLVADRWPLLSGAVYQAEHFRDWPDQPIRKADLLRAYGTICPPLIVYMRVTAATSLRRRPDGKADQFERTERRNTYVTNYDRFFDKFGHTLMRDIARDGDGRYSGMDFLRPIVVTIDNNKDMDADSLNHLMTIKVREVIGLMDDCIRRVAR